MAEPLTVPRRPAFEWLQLAKLLLLAGAVALAVFYLPNRIWDSMNGTFALVLGGIAAWRYSWWLTHFVRAQIYGRVVFPKLRRKAGALWSRGWRPCAAT